MQVSRQQQANEGQSGHPLRPLLQLDIERNSMPLHPMDAAPRHRLAVRVHTYSRLAPAPLHVAAYDAAGAERCTCCSSAPLSICTLRGCRIRAASVFKQLPSCRHAASARGLHAACWPALRATLWLLPSAACAAAPAVSAQSLTVEADLALAALHIGHSHRILLAAESLDGLQQQGAAGQRHVVSSTPVRRHTAPRACSPPRQGATELHSRRQ